MRFFLAVILFIGLNSFGQKLYPINKDGKWGLMTGEGEIKLKPVYDYIYYHGKGNKFIFDQRGKFGAMNANGSLYAEAHYDKIKFFDTTTAGFRLDGKWQLFVNATLELEEKYDSIAHIKKNVYALYKHGGYILYDTGLKQHSDQGYLSWSVEHNLVMAKMKNGYTDFYNPNNMELVADSVANVEWVFNSYGIVSYSESMQILNYRKRIMVVDEYPAIEHQFDMWYRFTSDTGSAAFNLATNELYEIRRCDEILDISGNLIAFKIGDYAGVWNIRKSKTVLAAKYPGVAIKNNMIFTQNGDKFGLCTADGKEILPPEYSDISDYGNLYRIKIGSKYGIANKSGKIIEECEYNKIDIFEKNVKCYKGKKLTTMNIDAGGNLKDRTEYNSYMTVSFVKARRARGQARSLTFNGNNLSGKSESDWNKKGWHQREMERKRGDSVVTVYGNWGLWDENDSVRIRYQFRTIETVPGISQLTRGYRKRPHKRPGTKEGIRYATQNQWFYQIEENIAFGNGKFKLVNHEDYRFLSGEMFLNIEFDDWRNYALARGFTKSPVLVDTSGKVIYDNLMYYDDYVEDKIRICQGGEYLSIKHNRGGLLIKYSELFSNIGLKYPSIDREYPHFRIKKGRWYFVDRNGNRLNEEAFQYAHPFENNRAIVLRNNLWGVVDSNMNVIVPLEYRSVKRVKIEGETFFQVERPNVQNYFYNKAGGSYRKTSVDGLKIRTPHNGMWLYDNKTETELLDSNLNSLGTSQYTQVFSGDGSRSIGKAGESYQFINKNGKLVGTSFETSDVTPLKYGRYMIKKGGNNFAIINKDGEYLVPKYIGNRILAINENVIFYLDYNLNFNYWANENIEVPKKVKVLGGDPEKGLLLIKKGKKVKVFNYKTGKYELKKAPGYIGMTKAGYTYEYDRLTGLINHNGDTLIKAKYWNIKYTSYGWGIGKIKSDKYELIDESGKIMSDRTFTSIGPIGSKANHFLVTNENGAGVMNENLEMIIPATYRSVTEKFGMYYMATDDTKETKFFDFSGKLLYSVEHTTQDGYPPSGYILKDPKEKGKIQYSYFYDGYKNENMKFFRIVPVSNNGFVLTEMNQMGVFSYEGDTIVPVEYHELKEVRGKFQVRFFNSFGYFEKDGKPLFDPKTTK